MSGSTATIDELKGKTLPSLFENTNEIGSYGPSNSFTPVSLNQFSDLMETGAVSRLAKMIGDIVASLSEADPKVLARKPSWWENLIGKHVEQQVKYQVARKNLDALLDDAKKVSLEVYKTLESLEQLISTHETDAAALKLYIDAGREYLAENPDAGVREEGVMEFDKPRERFARKLVNLATLQQSHEMSLYQMKMTRAQAIDMLDRFTETVSVLVPVWRQHTLSLITTDKMSPAMIAEATKAHGALMKSLAESLDGLE
ncbi:protein KlaA (plasmid) [Aeromonas media]|uniref:Protein KlaA n=1 Tax=Aeromonas media TaxID=651 RepID=A0ABX6NY22_AERME|nr:toxic anion resistance protein [Aeromonas media]QJT37109.1 protein KlaA [Aeromonas media]QJT41287.1 protein KlaA [Aeromonas media]